MSVAVASTQSALPTLSLRPAACPQPPVTSSLCVPLRSWRSSGKSNSLPTGRQSDQAIFTAKPMSLGYATYENTKYKGRFGSTKTRSSTRMDSILSWSCPGHSYRKDCFNLLNLTGFCDFFSQQSNSSAVVCDRVVEALVQQPHCLWILT